jgi:hypothetical protein
MLSSSCCTSNGSQPRMDSRNCQVGTAQAAREPVNESSCWMPEPSTFDNVEPIRRIILIVRTYHSRYKELAGDASVATRTQSGEYATRCAGRDRAGQAASHELVDATEE